jgi:hypothetical protein
MILQRGEFQADFAYDLGPHMQGLVCGFPFLERQRRPVLGIDHNRLIMRLGGQAVTPTSSPQHKSPD